MPFQLLRAVRNQHLNKSLPEGRQRLLIGKGHLRFMALVPQPADAVDELERRKNESRIDQHADGPNGANRS